MIAKPINLEVPVTANFDFLMDLPEDTENVVLEGSTRSTKTFSIMQYLIHRCINEPGLTVRCFRLDGVTHNETTVLDFLYIMTHQFKEFKTDEWSSVSKKYVFSNGSEFSFRGLNDIQKLQGPKQHIAWFEEAMECPLDAYTQVSYRTSGLMIFSFNPSISRHWIFKQIMNQPTTAYRHSTYKDNPYLSAKQVAKIEQCDPSVQANVIGQTADTWKWAVYGLGQRGKIEGAIYPLFGLVPYAEFPHRSLCAAFGYGLDFGYSVDPTALVECRICNGDLYVKLLTYEKTLLVQSNPNDPHQASIQQRLQDNGVGSRDLIVCDSAEPRSIKALKLCGYSTVGVEKGPGSKLGGITQVKTHRIFLAEEDSVLVESFEQYKWKKLPNGVTLKEPDHHMSDVPDAVRYFSMHHTERVRPGRRRQTRSKGRLADRLSRYGR